MPLHEKFNGENNAPGVWEIEEDEQWFASQISWNDYSRQQCSAIRHPQKKLQWLASRFLAQLMLGNPMEFELENDDFGKPFLRNSKLAVSISHAGNYAAVLVKESGNAGVDIELRGENVFRIANKFLHEEEKRWIAREAVPVAWSAKEAMYKFHGRRRLDFREHLRLHPFEVKPQSQLREQIIPAEFLKGKKEKVEIRFEQNEEFILAWI